MATLTVNPRNPSFGMEPVLFGFPQIEMEGDPLDPVPVIHSSLPSAQNQLSQFVTTSLKGKCVLFGTDCNPHFSFLSNDYPSPVEFGGLHYTCATAAYEAQKFIGQPDLMKRFTTMDAKQAYAFSAEKHLCKTPGWHEKRSETMYHVLRAKFGENQDLLSRLLLTVDSYLCLHSPYKKMDPFWTDDSDGTGANEMGRLLMEIRREFGGCSQASPPTQLKGLISAIGSDKKIPDCLAKTDHEIVGEIDDLNSRINEDFNRSHTQIARFPMNGPNTRFPFNNFPYDKTLVPLSSGRYINASFVLGKQYIGTQSPMPHTKEDFWSMALEQNVPIVVMLNRLGDPGDEIYFPFAKCNKEQYGKIHLELMEEPQFVTDPSWRQSPHEEEPHAIILRKIKIWKEGEEPRIIHHFQYQNWRDFSAGNERAAAYLVKTVDALRQVLPEKGPVVVHCHAGVGRTSALITLLDQYPLLKEGKIDIKRSVERQRDPEEGRCNSMMQATDQYHFCYRTLRLLSES